MTGVLLWFREEVLLFIKKKRNLDRTEEGDEEEPSLGKGEIPSSLLIGG